MGLLDRFPVRLIGPAVFSLIVLSMLTIAVLCLASAAGRVGKPFASFLYHQSHDVGSVNDREWAGVQAGVRYRDVILEVNGRKVHSGNEIEEIVSRTPVGEKLHYLLSRRGQMFEVDIPVSLFTLNDFLKTFGMLYPFGIALWMIGIVVYVLKRDTYVSWVFLLFCLSLGMYALTSIDIFTMHDPPWSYHLNMWALAFYPAASIHLSLLFPEKTATIQKWPRLPVLLYGISLVLAVSHSFYFEVLRGESRTSAEMMAAAASMLHGINFNRLYTLVGFIALVSAGVHAYRRSSSVIVKQRARIILLSSGVAFIPPGIVMAGVTLGKLAIPFNWITPIVIVFPVAIGFAIARHNLFDVDVYIKRTVGYALMTLIVGTGYFVVQVGMKRFILEPALGAQAENVYPIVFALLVVFFFNPINQRVQAGVDKLFFRRQYDYKKAVASVTDALTSVLDLNEIISKVIGTVRQEMFVDTAGVVLLDDRKKECRSIFMGEGPGNTPEQNKELCVSYDDPLLALLAREKTLITKYDIAEDPRYAEVSESCGRRFAEIGASLAFPLFSRDEFTGVLALGYKKSGHFYTREDIDLLKTVSAMTSTAIEQAREKGQKEIMRKLFEKHVSPEVAEAVWQQRELFLEGGRPRSQKLIVTVLFTDLKGFSTVSERMDPQALMDWLNGYMDKMTKIVIAHGGIVDDFFGDAIKVNFGVPLPRTTEAEISQDAMNAVNCALAMEEEMVGLNRAMLEQGLPILQMRVGIYTGPAVAGSLGSADRLKYTTIGDTVNTASRLESFDKDLVLPHLETSPCRILIGESTLRYVEDQFEAQQVGDMALKGKATKVTAYCVLGRKSRLATEHVSQEAGKGLGRSPQPNPVEQQEAKT
jgi:class 3 adenylate cyclase